VKNTATNDELQLVNSREKKSLRNFNFSPYPDNKIVI